uniref:Uncharacterized protein n=1 Tax=Oryza meridionalis TaxID=40149 RepID=A0A0E0DFB1_9ORYZ
MAGGGAGAPGSNPATMSLAAASFAVAPHVGLVVAATSSAVRAHATLKLVAEVRDAGGSSGAAASELVAGDRVLRHAHPCHADHAPLT